MPSDRPPTSFRFEEEVRDMLRRLTAWKKGEGGSQAAMVAELIREAFFAHQKEIERYEKRKGKE
jgi:hypothetical protein